MLLGMLALARRSVVTDHVNTLLKVGLGPLGKVRIVAMISRQLLDPLALAERSKSRPLYLCGVAASEWQCQESQRYLGPPITPAITPLMRIILGSLLDKTQPNIP